MPRHLLLRHPSANRVYAGESARLSAAELEIIYPIAGNIHEATVSGVGYLSFDAAPLDRDQRAIIATSSAALALFQEQASGLLDPLELPTVDVLDDDLVTIPKYQGKTNERFTKLLYNVTMAAVRRQSVRPRQILDPLCGRGTTLATAMIAGDDAFGVEADVKAFEQWASFIKSWLRRKRYKHRAEISTVRRDGKTIGKRFDLTIYTPQHILNSTTFTGDTRCSAELFGKKKFDAIITDAPYGVVHAAAKHSEQRATGALFDDAVPVWASQLMHGGALGVSWNCLTLPREDLAAMMARSGLDVCQGGPWERFTHRVDSSIKRDLMVAVKP